MKVNLGIWDKLSRLVVLLLVIACVLWAVLSYLPLIQQNQAKRRDILRLQSEIEQLREYKSRREAETNAYQDPRTLEHLGREILRWAKTNETLIYFVPAGSRPAGISSNASP